MSADEKRTIDYYSGKLSDPGSIITSYLPAKDRKSARTSAKSLNQLIQPDDAERIYLNCPHKEDAEQYNPSVFGGPLEYRIEIEAEVGHMDCLGSIYRLFTDLKKSVLYQLPYDNLDKIKEFMTFSGISVFDLIEYITTADDLYTQPNLEVLDYLALKSNGEIHADFISMYMNLNPEKKQLEEFVNLIAPKLHDYDFVTLIESLGTNYDIIRKLCDEVNDDNIEIIGMVGIREERIEMIRMVRNKVNKQILEKLFKQANYTYYNSDYEELQNELKLLYKGNKLEKNLSNNPNP